ncbi:YqiJ family protein [Caulobacter hibisci]|uniref:YqiJ family protein n=1 Tax=Caulobacter hibisci TaxID=2035993 RepID=A0ABS0SZ32_9CAUL|nr:YqiJ family protein [Caulobacter hibisci]MBI1684696.1 YqiJ family protein [Caulobacter hibisci]
MWSFLSADGNTLFLAALLLMLLIGAVEAAGLGAGLGHDGLDGHDLDHPSLLGWLNVGRLPLLMVIVVFLFAFGTVGLVLQQLIAGVFRHPAPIWIAGPLATAVALPFTRVLGRLLARVLPGDETTAVSRETLVGRVATIVTGQAKVGSPAQARVRDAHGQAHYVMVEPDEDGEVFEQGTSVIIVRNAGARFLAIRNESDALRER